MPAWSASSFVHEALLDGKPIGQHHFTLTPETDGMRLTGQAQFTVRILGVRVYDYDHRVEERWLGSCLASLTSSTRENGSVTTVNGKQGQQGFSIDGVSSSPSTSPCIPSLAYWNRDVLVRQKHLLNPQTGKIVDVRILPDKPLEVPFGEATVKLERFRILGDELDITVGYEITSGQWVTLDSRLSNGRLLQYRLKPGFVLSHRQGIPA